MYLAEHFKISEREEIFAFLEANSFGQLISVDNGKLTASHLPFLLTDNRQSLRCHLARPNRQWQTLEGQQVLVSLQGPHDYVSPSWYQDPGVPTWNYQALHLYGTPRVFDDATELAALVEALSERYEAGFATPWQPQYGAAMRKGIVGVEIEIVDIQCKYKLSQNRSAADRRGAIDNLEQRDASAVATAMRNSLL